MLRWYIAALFAVLTGAIIPGPDANGKYHIEAEGIKACFIPYGASITNLYVCDRNGTWRDIVLGYDDAGTYASSQFPHTNYGAIPGRYANRLSNATYVLDGVRYHTEVNDPPNSTIHSGTNGWSYRYWDVSAVSKESIAFVLSDANNSSMGFPGLVLGKVTYTVSKLAWSVRIEAEARDHRTPLMLTNHAYWNLDAFANPYNDTVLGHTLSMPFGKRKIGFDAVSQPDGTLPYIPRGSINDFWSHPKKIGASDSDPEWLGNCGPGVPGYDCQWLIDRGRDQLKKPVASLWSEWSGIKWDLYTNQEGLVMSKWTCSSRYFVLSCGRLKLF